MRLLDRYEHEFVEAARCLAEEPAARGRGRRAAGRALGMLAWAPAVVALAVAVAVSAVVMTGGGGRGQAQSAPLAGWYASSAGSGEELPKGAPAGSTLRLGRDGRYGLTTGVYRVSGRYRLTDDTLLFVSAGRYEFLPTLRTRMVRLPNEPRCRAAVGVYRITARAESLTLEPAADPCRARARVLSAAVWQRAGR